MARMPTIEEVLAYAKPIVHKFISTAAANSPPEQQEEIAQNAYIRLIGLYGTIDPDAGWKSWVYNHCRGAVLDYLKFGQGFEEGKWSLQEDNATVPKLTKRVETKNSPEDGDDNFDLDHTLGSNGKFSELDMDPINIKWDLLAKMCSTDENLHAFAKYLRGISIEDMAPVFGLCRTRVSQLFQAFIERFDDPEKANDPWFKQTCYALGLCRHLGMPELDQADLKVYGAMGHTLNPVDLDSVKPHHYLLELDAQMDMLNVDETQAQ